MKLSKENAIDLLHISGSIASVTAIALVLAEKTIGAITIGQILGYVASSSASIALLMLVGIGMLSLHEDIEKPALRIIYWMGLTPFVLFIYLLLVRVIFELGVGFFSLIMEPM